MSDAPQIAMGATPAESGEIVPLLVDADGLAVLLGVSRRTVRRQDDGGMIPAAIMIGSCKRWSRAEIEAWLHAGAPDRRQWNAMRMSSA